MPGIKDFEKFISKIRSFKNNRFFIRENCILTDSRIGKYLLVKAEGGSFSHYIVFMDKARNEGRGGTAIVHDALPFQMEPPTKSPKEEKKKRKGEEDEGGYGRIILPGKLTSDKLKRPIFQKPLVAKFTKDIPREVLNTEARIMNQSGRFATTPTTVAARFPYIRGEEMTPLSDYSVTISEFIPGADLTKQNFKKMSLQERTQIITRYAAELNSLHHYTPSSDPIVHKDIKPVNMSIGGSLYDFGFSQEVDDDKPGAQLSEVDTVGTTLFMAPERLAGKTTLNSDIYSLVPAVLMLLGVSEQEIFSKKNALLKQMQDIQNNPTLSLKQKQESIMKLKREMQNTGYSIKGLLNNISLPQHLVCPKETFKDLVTKFLERMQHPNPIKRVNSDELLQFSLALQELVLQAQQPTTNSDIQYSCLAKMALISNNLWETEELNFSFFDFDSEPDFCRAITILHSLEMLNDFTINELISAQKLPHDSKEKSASLETSSFTQHHKDYCALLGILEDKQLLSLLDIRSLTLCLINDDSEKPLAALIASTLKLCNSQNGTIELLKELKNKLDQQIGHLVKTNKTVAKVIGIIDATIKPQTSATFKTQLKEFKSSMSETSTATSEDVSLLQKS